jgi:hypothetical protein
MKRVAAGVSCGALAFLLFAEVLCRVLPVSESTRTGYYIDPHIPTYPPHHAFRVATGWDLRNPQRVVANNFGFVGGRDFRRGEAAVALIGDSFVEAASLAAEERPVAQLERALGGRPVYAMGWGGTSLLDYAERIRFAHENFGVSDFVILMERGDVRQALCGSGNVASRCLDPVSLAPRTVTAPAPSLAKELLRESAFAQYLVSQLKIDPARLPQQLFARSADSAGGARPAAAALPERFEPRVVEAVAHTFFESVRPYATGRLVIVLDSDRRALQQHRIPTDPERDHFIALARAAGATVVDTEPVFRSYFETSGLSLDIGPYDAHFNARGVRVVTAAAARALLIGPMSGNGKPAI